MNIHFSPYTLHPRSALNGRHDGGARNGALLRIETSEWVGFADLHPWTELGDLSLADQLRYLSEGFRTSLLERALFFAESDGRARASKQSLFTNMEIPESHFLLTDLSQTGPDRILAIYEDGFRCIKIKVGHDLENAFLRLQRLFDDWPEGLAVRLDLNACVSLTESSDFFLNLKGCNSYIEFVEDPGPYDLVGWTHWQKTTGLAAALDREALVRQLDETLSDENSHDPFRYVILKPAVQAPQDWIESANWRRRVAFVVTSYMDHPLGQAAAAWEAARLEKRLSEFGDERRSTLARCGLLSHFSYLPNEFSESLLTQGPRLMPQAGHGFGFDDLLQRLRWRNLR